MERPVGIRWYHLFSASHRGKKEVTLRDQVLISTQVIVEGRWKEIPRFFPGARLNYAENILRFNGDSIACTGVRESGEMKHYSFRELRTLVKDMAAAMRVNGVCVGDRVAGVSICHSIEDEIRPDTWLC